MRGRVYSEDSPSEKNTVVKSGWSLIRVVIREELYCTQQACPAVAVLFEMRQRNGLGHSRYTQ